MAGACDYNLCVENRSGKFLRKVCTFLPDYTASQLGRFYRINRSTYLSGSVLYKVAHDSATLYLHK